MASGISLRSRPVKMSSRLAVCVDEVSLEPLCA